MPTKGNKTTSWKEAYIALHDDNDKEAPFEVSCLYEDVSEGEGSTLEEAKADFCENIRLKIQELTEMLEFCALNKPRTVESNT
jgi:hypothetical protein